MSDNILCFDIETIPQQEPLQHSQYEDYKKRVKSYLKKAFPNGCTYSEYKKVSGMIMATSPYLGEIITIGIHSVSDDEEESIAIVGTEKEILTKFWNGIKGFNGLFVSFNGLDFDVPFIIKRSMKHGIRPTNNNFMDLKRFSRYPHFDVKQVVSDFDRYAIGNLDMLTQFVGVPSPKQGAIKAENVADAFKAGKIDEIAEYCINDVKSTFEVYKIVKYYTYNPAPAKRY